MKRSEALSSTWLSGFWTRLTSPITTWFTKHWTHLTSPATYGINQFGFASLCMLMFVSDHLPFDQNFAAILVLYLFSTIAAFAHNYMIKTKDWDNPVLLIYPTLFPTSLWIFITGNFFFLGGGVVLALTVFNDIKKEKKAIKDEEMLAEVKRTLSNLVSENDFAAKGYES